MTTSQNNIAAPVMETPPQNDKITKQSIRVNVWEDMVKNKVFEFPKPFGRIPNFKNADLAAKKLLELDEFINAKSVEVNPDKPLEHSRIVTLENDKELYVPIPRLQENLLKKLSKGEEAIQKTVSRWGIEHSGKTVNLDDNIHIDLFVLGSVAVSKKGQRIGKGKGYADLEFAILKDMKAVDDNTVIVTTVHDSQVFDKFPTDIFGKHDVPVDYILTPTQIIKVEEKLPRPERLFWDILSKRRVRVMKILEKLRKKHESDGVNTTLKEVDSDVEETDNRRFIKRSFRRNRRTVSEVEENDERKIYRKRYYRRSNRDENHQINPPATETNNIPTNATQKSPKRRPYKRNHIEYSLLVSNIDKNVRVKDLKNALMTKGVKPYDITWRGYKGFCYLHYTKPLKKSNKENENETDFSVDSVIDIIQSLKINKDSCLEVKVMEPITRIETTDVTAV